MYDSVWQCMEIKYNLLTKQNFIFFEGQCPLKDFEQVYNLPLLPHNTIPVSGYAHASFLALCIFPM